MTIDYNKGLQPLAEHDMKVVMIMPDDSSFRRLGRKNRKTEIKSSGALFPVSDADDADNENENAPVSVSPVASAIAIEKPEPPTPEKTMPDLSALDNNDDDLAFLSALPQGLVARPLNIAPPEHRYPPLAPTIKAETQPTLPASLPVQPQASPSRRRLYNLITLLATFGTIALVVVYSLIWQDPQTLLNPLPPPIVYIQVTATPLPATPVTFSSDTQAVPTPDSAYPFGVTATGVTYIANANGRACEWASIAGVVTGKDGSALNGYRVRFIADAFDETVFSGASLTYGAGGFELPLGNAPVQKIYQVQLFSPQGAPLSVPNEVQTQANCDQNVAIVNFQEN
jgi:hypothetical protein